jgi:hypothetical protein
VAPTKKQDQAESIASALWGLILPRVIKPGGLMYATKHRVSHGRPDISISRSQSICRNQEQNRNGA